MKKMKYVLMTASVMLLVGEQVAGMALDTVCSLLTGRRVEQYCTAFCAIANRIVVTLDISPPGRINEDLRALKLSESDSNIAERHEILS